MAEPSRVVFTLCAGPQPRSGHERATQDWVARRLASILGWEYGGGYTTHRHEPARAYLVPDETLTAAQAAELGAASEGDLFGGVVPHPFVASKVITHPLPGRDSPAPDGWNPALAPQLAGAVLSGFSVFDPDGIVDAGARLLALGGPVRLKEPSARGGHGQHLVGDVAALRDVAESLDRQAVHAQGIVLEQHLERATTCSVGEVRIGGRRLAYLGTQQLTVDREGREVYAGSSLRVVQGGLDALAAIATDAIEQDALRCARRYDAAVAEAYPGLLASRRNYDVIAGHDAQGRRRCGVLEQSWRLGGASPAEVVALAAMHVPGAPPMLRVSCHESHDPRHVAPPGAEVYHHDRSATEGPLLKYARVEESHGHTP